MKLRALLRKKSTRLVPAEQDSLVPSMNPKVSTRDIVSAYKDYTRSVRSLLLHGAGLAILAIALVGLLTVTAAAVPERGPHFKVLLVPIPMSIGVAGFSIFAALAIALQIAVRTPGAVKDHLAQEIARRYSLVMLARMLTLATLILGLYLCIPALLAAPYEFDLVRLFGPNLLALTIAIVAADAGVAADPQFGPDEQRTAWRQDQIDAFKDGLRVLAPRAAEGGLSGSVRQILLLAVVPAALAVLSAVVGAHSHIVEIVLLVILELAVAGAIYLFASKCLQYAVTRDWGSLLPAIIAAVAVTIIAVMVFATALYGIAEKDGSLGQAAWGALWGIAYVALPLGLALRSLATPRGHYPPRLLRQLVAHRVTQKLNRIQPDSPQARTRRKANPLAIFAVCISPLIPFGLVLAVIARIQIAHADQAEPSPDRLGKGCANAAILLTLVVVIATVLVLVVVGATNPAFTE